MNKKTSSFCLLLSFILLFNFSEAFSEKTQITITRFIFNPSNPTLDSSVQISVEVKNYGSLRSQETTIMVDSPTLKWRSRRTLPELDPDQSTVLEFDTIHIPSTPLHENIEFRVYRTNGGQALMANITLKISCIYSAGRLSGTGIDIPAKKELIRKVFIHKPSPKITLNDKDSYDFSEGKRGETTGGDFYLLDLKFWANNEGQRGVLDLGDIGQVPLNQVDIPSIGYNRFGVSAVEGHTYVSLAQEGEEGNYIIFRIIKIEDLSVTIEFFYSSQL
ncbi:MAG: hypothetical protein AB1410_07935 [Acidobacteriota bacterium]